MTVVELINHLKQLPQDYQVEMVVNTVSGETAPVLDICVSKLRKAVEFDLMKPIVEGKLHYELSKNWSKS